MIKAILCVDKQGAIGQNGDMPWGRSFPKDLEYFKKVTSEGIVVMGSKTWKSLPFYPKGLPKRDNYVLTTQGRGQQGDGVIKLDGDLFSKCVTSGESIFNHKDTWIIGGATVYEEFADIIDEWHITTIDNIYPEADTFFKVDLTNFEDTLQYSDVGNEEIDATVSVYRRKQ